MSKSCDVNTVLRKVLVIAPTMFSADYGGAVRIIEHIKALSLLGVCVDMYTYSVQGALDRALSVEVHGLPIVPRFHQGTMLDRFYLDFLLASKIFLANNVKPVFVLSYNQEATLISKITNLFRSPIVMDAQGVLREEFASHGRYKELSKIVYIFERKLFEFPSLILASSPFLANFIIHELGANPKKVEVVLDTADTNLFMPRSKDDTRVEYLRSTLGIKKGARVVLYVGSFSALQGTDILLKSVKYVLEQEKDLFFVLAGGRWSKDYESYIQTAENLGISSHIKFIPGVSYIRTLPYLLNLADIAVAPKRFSLQSHAKLAVLMASGLPSVVFDNPINRLFLGSLGIYAKEANAEAIAEAVILGMNKADDNDLHEKLRERAVRHFSLQRLVSDMQRVYERVAGQFNF